VVCDPALHAPQVHIRRRGHVCQRLVRGWRRGWGRQVRAARHGVPDWSADTSPGTGRRPLAPPGSGYARSATAGSVRRLAALLAPRAHGPRGRRTAQVHLRAAWPGRNAARPRAGRLAGVAAKHALGLRRDAAGVPLRRDAMGRRPGGRTVVVPSLRWRALLRTCGGGQPSQSARERATRRDSELGTAAMTAASLAARGSDRICHLQSELTGSDARQTATAEVAAVRRQKAVLVEHPLHTPQRSGRRTSRTPVCRMQAAFKFPK